jgi:hypothetical protein
MCRHHGARVSRCEFRRSTQRLGACLRWCLEPEGCRGSLSSWAIVSKSTCDSVRKSSRLGRYWRSRPLVFSLLPRCQDIACTGEHAFGDLVGGHTALQLRAPHRLELDVAPLDRFPLLPSGCIPLGEQVPAFASLAGRGRRCGCRCPGLRARHYSRREACDPHVEVVSLPKKDRKVLQHLINHDNMLPLGATMGSRHRLNRRPGIAVRPWACCHTGM